MSVSLVPDRLRFALQQGSHDALTDLYRGSAPVLWCRMHASIDVALFALGYLVEDFTDVDSLVCELHESTRVGSPLWQKTVAGGDIDDTLTLPEWDSNAVDKYHARFELSDEDTALDVTGGASDLTRVFWLVFHLVKTDGTQIVCGVASVTFEEHGAQNGLSVVPLTNPSFRISDGELQIYNPDEETWHTIYVRGAAGAEQIVLGGGE